MFGWYPTRGSSATSTKVKVDARKVNDSVYELHKPPGNPSAQIVFFHGLYTGDSSDAHLWTWESEDGSCIWPATWLVEEFPAAHVLSVSYCGSVGKSSQGSLDMHNIGENLISDLMHANIGQAPYCPVILVGYCFGGLVIKELCCQISLKKNLIKLEGEKKKLETFLDNLRAVFYYGTPHSGFTDKVTCVVESTLLQYLSTLNKETCRLNHHFDQLHRASKWRIDGLGENLPAKKGICKGVVVASETTARGGDLFNVLPVEHFTICKPSSKKDKRFYALTNLLHSVAENQEAIHKCQGLPRYLIALERRAQEVQAKLMNAEVIGLVGMGGIGKTTLAKQVFNYISREFEYTCFVDNVKGIPQHELEKSILSGFYQSGRKMDSNKMSWSQLKGKTLIVMDDVDFETQLLILPTLQSFGIGSRLVVTSRDQSIFSFFENYALYDVEFLRADQAKILFCQYAHLEEELGNSEGTGHLGKNVKAVVDKCGGLPLTLEVMGCYLRGHASDVTYWEETIRKLQKAQSISGGQNDRVWATLKVSYDSLAPREQKMFIEASIYFFGKSLDKALAAWKGAYENSKTEWENLMRRSLVKEVSKRNWDSHPFDDKHKTVWVHEHLRDLATSLSKFYIVSGGDDVRDSPTLACMNKLNTNEVKAKAKIVRIRNHDSICSLMPLQLDSVAKLNKLRYLELYNVKPEGSMQNFPRKLSLLRWRMPCNSRYLFPSCSHNGIRNLVVLELENWGICKEFPQLLGSLTNLRILSLRNLRGLDHLPENFGNLSGLEKLELTKLDLQALSSSFGSLPSLRELTLNLPGLQCLPDNVCRLQGLKKLVIWTSGFDDGLQTLSDNLGLLSRLAHLRIRSTTLRMLPDNLGELSRLKALHLHVKNVHVLPASVGQLSALLELDFTSAVVHLPESLGRLSSLKVVRVGSNNLVKLPDIFQNLCSLETLDIRSNQLESLPQSIGRLSSLSKCSIQSKILRSLPESIGQMSAFRTLIIKRFVPEKFNLSIRFWSFGTMRILSDSLESLPESVGQLSSLRSCSIDSEILRSLPDSILQLSLEQLKIKCPILKLLPESLGELSRLTTLHLDLKKVKVLPASVGQLSALRELDFTSAVDHLPESLGQLSLLKVLSLSSDNLVKLPDIFQNLCSLETLDIRSKKLESLPESIGQLSTLRSCSIDSEILRSVPDSIVQLSLQQLKIKCPVLKLLPESLGELARLEILSLDVQAVKVLPASVGQLSALRELDFTSAVEHLPESLGQLSSLKVLRLISDNLVKLPDIFQNLCSLETLDICSNKLESLPESIVELSTLRSCSIDSEILRSLSISIVQLSVE